LFQIKKNAQTLYGLLFDMSSDHSCYQQSLTVVTRWVMSAVAYRVRPS